jgi:glycosyltransferase involved in cell wall biosynthesis
MRVSVLSPDLSINCLVRAHLLAELLERTHEVEIVGPKTRGDVWEPLRDAHDYRGVDSSLLTPRFLLDAPTLLDRISGDVVYASKPRLASYGLGLYETLRRDVPLVLDIDDWESGLIYGRSRNLPAALLWGVPALAHHNSLYYTRSLEALTGLADATTVSNRFLQERFGGVSVPHVRDTSVFDPSKYDRAAVRDDLGLPTDDPLILFSGTPRPHKGVEDLVVAVDAVDREDVRALIVGADDSEYTERVRRVGGDSVRLYGPQPFDEIPKWIAAADVVAVPQRRTPTTRGQMPAKVFDAMAMGKPIVATDVCDLAHVLDGCGRIVPPESPEALRDVLTDLLDDPALRADLGRAARQRCVERYSYDALAPVVADVIESVVDD